MNSIDDRELVRKIVSFSEGKVPIVEQFSEQVMQTFFEVGSRTPDNVQCSQHVEFGPVSMHDDKNVYGLKIRGTNILLSDLMNTIESNEVPEAVKRFFPDLTAAQFAAATRMMTVLLAALEYNPRL